MENKSTDSPTLEFRLLYSRKMTAQALCLSLQKLDLMIAAKKIETRRIGARVLIPREELIRLSEAESLV